MNIQIIQAKSSLHKLKPGRLPFPYDLNIYRGCMHKCIYCYAIYSHKYMESDDYYETIFVKENIAEVLDKELSTIKKKGTINLSGVCDSYQPIEKKFELMRDVLTVLIKHKWPTNISTKSALILRDLDLWKQLSEVASVNIAFTVTTTNDDIAKQIESGASSSTSRLEAASILKKETCATVGIHLMPIIPYITDHKVSLHTLYKFAYDHDFDYIMPGMMYLRGQTRKVFFQSIRQTHPHLYDKLNRMYQDREYKNNYRTHLYKYIGQLRKQYPLTYDAKNTHKQEKLF